MSTVDDLSRRLAAISAKTPEQLERLATALAEPKGVDADASQLVGIVNGLTQEYVRLANAVCNDTRVPEDLRDEVKAHAATVLTELQAAIDAC